MISLKKQEIVIKCFFFLIFLSLNVPIAVKHAREIARQVCVIGEEV